LGERPTVKDVSGFTMKVLQKLCVVIDRDCYSIDGVSVRCGDEVSYAAGRVVLEKIHSEASSNNSDLQNANSTDAANLRISYLEGISTEASISSDIDRNGEYHFGLENGLTWFRERPDRLQRLLGILNIPEAILSQHETMQILVQKDKLKTQNWPNDKDPSIRTYYRKGSGRPMIDRLFVLHSVTENELARFLSSFIFGVELGLDYFDALEEGLEAAHAWVKNNVIVEVGHSHYGTPNSRKTYLMMADAADRFHSDHKTMFRPSEPKIETGHAKAVELLAQRFGYRNVLRGNVLDMPGEQADPATEQLAYFDAWEDVNMAADLIDRVYKPLAVERRGKTIPHFVLRSPTSLVSRQHCAAAEYIGDVEYLGIPADPESMISYGQGDYIEPLFKKHGMELVELLHASIPHTRRMSAPQLWRHYESIKPLNGLAQGTYESKDHGDRQVTKLSEFIRPIHEMCELPATMLNGKAMCLTSSEASTIAEDAIFAGFLTDASRAHILIGEDSAAKKAVLWLPMGRSFSYLAVVKQNFQEKDGIGHKECDIALWGFTVSRSESGLSVSPFEPPKDYALYYSKYGRFYVYDALTDEMPRFVKE
jgi:hypothetical protein